MQEAVHWVPALHEMGVVTQAVVLTQEMEEAGRSEVQGHFQLSNELETNLGYMRPCLNPPPNKD